ncbi:hypothetical protein J3Q64DRAFT_1633521 [Phycomyces blakesleeanus]|uniref:L domain-like protein n=1 Tax=Phycomyces blakesleeanus TaxID=4837 RepID=A0ABR3BBS3_PHYBL
MSQNIRPYQPSDNEAIRKLYIDKEKKLENKRIFRAMLESSLVQWSWPMGIVGIAGYNMTTTGYAARQLMMLFCLETTIWSAGLGLAWYFYLKKRYRRAISRRSNNVLRNLTATDGPKSGSWVMERKDRIIGAVGIQYEDDEGKIQSLTSGDKQAELALVQSAIKFAKKKEIKVIIKRGNDTTRPTIPLIIDPTDHEHPINHLFSPTALISRLTRLTFLDLSHNQLETLPESICYLKHLQHLNLANNRIPELPSVVQFFVKLNHLDLSNNPLEELSANIARLTQLTMLDLTGTNISNVPSELLRLTRVSVRVDNCPNIAERSVSFYQTLKYDPPSLLEICSRIVMRPLLLDSATKKKMVSQRTLDSTFSLIPQNVKDFLSSPKACSFCEGPYFKACVLRYRIVQRHDDTYLPVEYRLCSAHWSDEDDRLLTMFAEQPITMIPRLRKRRELRYTVPNF